MSISIASDQSDAVAFSGPYVSEDFRLRTLLCGRAGRTYWPLHIHAEHELFWGVQGRAQVIVGGEIHVVPPGGALLVPAMVPHEMRIDAATTLKCTLISAENYSRWPFARPVVIPNVVGEMLDYLDVSAMSDDVRRRMEDIAIDLIGDAEAMSATLPLPRDPGLLRVARQVSQLPEDGRTIVDWADEAAMSLRSFTRKFKAETGMSFGSWQTLARMQSAVALLRDGCPPARVAIRVGYGNVSAFASAFRRVTGLTPATYARMS